jgi:hypothetical protein
MRGFAIVFFTETSVALSKAFFDFVVRRPIARTNLYLSNLTSLIIPELGQTIL